MRRLALRIVLSLAVAALLLAGLLAWGGVSPATALSALARLPFTLYLAALGLHVCTYLLRAWRLNLLLPAGVRPSFRRALVVSAAHNMASYVLPAKTGEASLVLYLRLYCGVSSSIGLAALLVSRFLDGAGICLALSAACLVLLQSGEYQGLHWLGSVGAGLVLASLAFLALSTRGDLLVRGLERALFLARLDRWKRGESILSRTNDLAVALRGAGSGGRLLRAALTTVPAWCSVFAFYTVLGHAMGLPAGVDFVETAFGSSLATLANLLPVNGMAGVGTQELGWVTGFHRYLGVDYDLALATGMGVHFVQLFNIVVFGFAAHLAMGMMPRLSYRMEGEGSR
jgi:hypothetical protein